MCGKKNFTGEPSIVFQNMYTRIVCNLDLKIKFVLHVHEISYSTPFLMPSSLACPTQLRGRINAYCSSMIYFDQN